MITLKYQKEQIGLKFKTKIMSEGIKYYTPDVSDLFVGYELEYDYTDGKGDWKEKKLSISDMDYFVRLTNTDSGKYVRVPYLSIDQIIKEGWNTSCNLDNNYIHFSHNKKELAELCFTKNDFHLKCPLVLIQNSMVGRVGEVECKSINEFRKICKWLKIN